VNLKQEKTNMTIQVEAFFDPDTFTVTYVVADSVSRVCAIVDSVLDFEPASGRTSTHSADLVIDYIQSRNLSVAWILETHVHADHLSAAQYLKSKVGGQTGISKFISGIQATFKDIFNLDDSVPDDGRQFDSLLEEGDVLPLGELSIQVMHTPGHTPACLAFLVADALFVGDTLFMPDFGTARVDFPGGDAATLYQSIQRIFTLPDETRLFMCHDYKAPGREVFAWETTVADERENNLHIHAGVTEQEFVAFRQARDATLSMPRLILPSIQVNIRAGEMPSAEDNGVSYLKLPIDAL
jgi:glyoxylase-like metal-dependent hydrolase (beta-lactamase superfamily II)